MKDKNFLLFIAVSFLIFAGWLQLRDAIWPPPKREEKKNVEVKPEPTTKTNGSSVAVKAIAGPWAELKKPAPARPPVAQIPAPAPPTPPDKLITLGTDDRESQFHIKAVLDPRGAGIRSVVLNKFKEASKMGRPVWLDQEKKIPAPLELVPANANQDTPSNVLYHFRNVDDDRPMDTLGNVAWTKAGPVEQELTNDVPPRQRQRVTFQTEIQGVQISKSFTLTEGEYHLGLEVKLKGNHRFRYQLAGARGLPIEGRWYTGTFRNALIGRSDGKGGVWRDLQELREIGQWEGGKEIFTEPGKPIRYAGVAIQYFASMTVVDESQSKQDYLKQARPSLETGVARGLVNKVDKTSLLLNIAEGKDRVFYLANQQEVRDELLLVREGTRLAVIYHVDGRDRPIVTRIAPEMSIQPLWEEDITVRVATDTIELKPGEEVTHKYLLYNGPVKPSLLSGMTGAAEVSPALVQRYAETLSLNTMTDSPSPNWAGRFANSIYWTQLIILFTNLMHWVLGRLHVIVFSYGICIVLLTVMVRGSMFPLSRKQALMTQKMQELAPEMKKIQEKYKDNPQERGLAQMSLYKRHGVKPHGTCLILFLQMPVFMGLYFALQESIQFRLEPFWPTWIKNLAAPDMMLEWGENIWLLSRPEDYGGFLYLGPYFNLLPVIAVALMLVQQKLMTPPATNEEEAMRNAMMKYMMIFFGLMFYKVASGLCIYFIASSVWGFAERKLLPKKKAAPGAAAAVTVPVAPIAASDSDGRVSRNRRKPERSRKEDESTILGRLMAWWHKILEQAEKK